MANNLFCEPELGHVAHNCTSLVMLEDEALASWVGLYTVDLFLPVGNTVTAMQKWPGSEDLTETVGGRNGFRRCGSKQGIALTTTAVSFLGRQHFV